MLEQAGFTIESEKPELDYYGSLRTIFVAGEKRVLLEWDGEEGFGYAEVWKNGEWEQLRTNVLESKESEFRKAIETLAEEIKEYI
ncbi:MAG: hypothetical protein R3F41_04915 [Gammaproteobacteria bacterium]|nr:hypothetical protein [Pseudomonadales bacterium]